MEVPCSLWPQGPWSPLGYQVVEVVDENVPGTEDGPQPGRPSRRGETSQPPRLPWALPGYRVVEVAVEPSPGPTRRPSPGAGAAKGSPRRKIRPLVRWGAVAVCGSFLLAAAIALGLLRLPTWTRGAGDHAPSEENGLLGEPRCAARDSRSPARETFGSAVGFVRNPAEAARIAAQEQKLTFLLHVSGSFDDAGLT